MTPLYRLTALLIEISMGAEIDLATQNVTRYLQWFANFIIANITARWEI